MKTVTIEFNVSDNFELYNCYMCPLYATDNYNEWCVLEGCTDECPIKFKEEEE